ncbi:unnamed protein product [Periconia digitata]|uniref:Cytochrome P450 n=1 Tax=Periconia digitata TaxID=1303443 RepID=A0A9W4XCS3_9PLEO|nr:unnamed protein product [Periconia digitata]
MITIPDQSIARPASLCSIMAWMNYLLYSAGAIVAILSFLFAQLLRLKFTEARQPIFEKVDSVHPSPYWCPPTFARNVTKSIWSTQRFATEGYLKFSKALDRPFALLTTWVGGSTVLVLPPSKIPMLTRPDKMKDGSEWTNLHGLIATTQLAYVIDDANIYENVLHFDVVRRNMAHRDMNRLAPVTADEIEQGFLDSWGTDTEWKTINGWDGTGKIISRAAQRILIGLPLSRDEKMLETSRLYATSLLVGGAIINCFPPWMRWVAAPVIALRARYYQSKYVKMLVPVVEERIVLLNRGQQEGPDDFLQWMLQMCADNPEQLEAERIALRVASLLTPLIFAICYVFSSCILDIHSSPYSAEILAGLKEECTRVSAEHGGFHTSAAVDALKRCDSVLRESMRVSDVQVTNIFRDVTAGEIDLGNNLRVGPGVRMLFPTQDIHMDPDNYPDPKKFDAFRFSRPFENADIKAEGEQLLIATPTPTFMPFGYGRHACPGRWFAAQSMKQALAYLVLHYDVELVGPPPKRWALLNMMIPPVDAKIKLRWKA